MLDTKKDDLFKRDLKEYKLFTILQRSIDLYKTEKLSLRNLIQNIETVIAETCLLNNKERGLLIEHCNNLDVEYGSSKINNKKSFNAREQEVIDASLKYSNDLAEKQLKKLTPLLEKYELEGYDIAL